MRFSTCVLRDFTLKRIVEKGENFGEDSDSYFVHFRDASSMYFSVASIAVLVPSGAVYVGIVEYFELFVRDNVFPLLPPTDSVSFSQSPSLYMARHLRVQGSSVRVRLILPRSVFTGKWVLSTDSGLVPG